MSVVVSDIERPTMEKSLRERSEGAYVTDDLYRHMLKEHDSGAHTGIQMNLCPACALA